MERGFDQGSRYVSRALLDSYTLLLIHNRRGPRCIVMKVSWTDLPVPHLKQTAFTVKVDVQLHFSNVGTMARSDKRAGRQAEHM